MSELIFYTTEDGITKVSVQLEDDTVWLTQKQMVELYQTAKSTISEHIKNIYAEEELMPEATVRKIRTVLDKMKEKATLEYKKYKAKTLSSVETEYLKTISFLEQQTKKGNKLSKAKGTTKKEGEA